MSISETAASCWFYGLFVSSVFYHAAAASSPHVFFVQRRASIFDDANNTCFFVISHPKTEELLRCCSGTWLDVQQIGTDKRLTSLTEYDALGVKSARKKKKCRGFQKEEGEGGGGEDQRPEHRHRDPRGAVLANGGCGGGCRGASGHARDRTAV